MITVEKLYINDRFADEPDIRISDGENSFIITDRPPDPAWFPDFKGNPFAAAEARNEDFVLAFKESDGEIYTLFNKLYKDILSGNISPLEKRALIGKTAEEVKELKKEKAKERKWYRLMGERTGLINNDVITFVSSDMDREDYASVLKISKEDKEIKIRFSKNKPDPEKSEFEYHPTYLIRISRSWSVHGPFIILFVEFYRSLASRDWEKQKVYELKQKTD